MLASVVCLGVSTEAEGRAMDEDDAEPMTAEQSLALIARQRERTRRELGVNPARLLAVWGVAWFVGWGLMYLARPGENSSRFPLWIPAVVLAVGFAAAIGYSIYYGTRAGRGIRGPSNLAGAMYGWSWTLGYAGLTVVNIRIGKTGLPWDTTSLLWTGSSLLLTGVLYLAGGAIWSDKLQFGLGVWMIVSAAASVFSSVPGNFLVLCLCGGGGFLVAAAVYTVRGRRPGRG
ncbi:hypothetical protein [Amycolatopsis sp. H20-H5]|uniref:hypothetical protein n=1 Tax=Amycolatopsis sp. H20-H5 TaxID=3046309 RepID=UPI002DBD8DB3|nr:hypothetical protein [Amycolatopsis sp. H20-H5]MEC3981310.1 hypothetical protein [Amycolatopsis sp. H20-H5]